LSSKTVDQLDNTMYRDTLKTQIAGRITQMIPSVSINTIYFSKYILQ
jgi:flagellar basal body-associated protein FliL